MNGVINNYFEEIVNNCINDFEKLYKSDRYISQRKIDKFLDRYRDVFEQIYKNKNLLDENKYNKIIYINNKIQIISAYYNDKFINNKLIEYKNYFDDMFKNVDAKIILDNEQRKAILIDEDYSLVVAGAGSGKTTTMAAKAKYLIEKCYVNPKEIMLLSFSRKAAGELDERINRIFNLNVPVYTFHSLGNSIINSISKRPLKLTDNNGTEFVNSYIRNVIFPNKTKLKELYDLFIGIHFLDDNIFRFENFDSYYDFFVNETYKINMNNLKDYNNNQIRHRKRTLRTIKNEFVKSMAEVEIANFLYCNGINYKYEKAYSEKINGNKTYLPDFTINAFNNNIYIEYYGLTSIFEDSNYSEDDIDYYNSIIEKKRKLHNKYGTDLIELYYKDDNDLNYIEVLEKELLKRGIVFYPKNDFEIFEKLMYSFPDRQIYGLSSLIMEFIKKFKSLNYNENDFERLKEKTDDGIVKNQIEFIKPIYFAYQKYLANANEIDFPDMINLAYKYLEVFKEKRGFVNYKYLIVDEYQDISEMRYNLVKKLATVFDSKIVAVGDDWQSIFGFSGSEVKLFTKFCDLMGYGEVINILNTYRFSQQLVNITTDFISKNTEQFSKKLIAHKDLNKPVKIYYYDDETICAKGNIIANIINEIIIDNRNSNILILGRYNDDIEELYDSGLFKRGIKDKIIFIEKPFISITFLTIHKSKGLGFDQVILINALDDKKGFPSKIIDNPLIKVFQNDDIEPVIYAEERRLFYVALTRTRNTAYIVAPNKNYSEFISEIRDNSNVLEIK